MQGIEPAKSHFQRVGQGRPAGPLDRQNKQTQVRNPLQLRIGKLSIGRWRINRGGRRGVGIAVMRSGTTTRPAASRPLDRDQCAKQKGHSALPGFSTPAGRGKRPVRQTPRSPVRWRAPATGHQRPLAIRYRRRKQRRRQMAGEAQADALVIVLEGSGKFGGIVRRPASPGLGAGPQHGPTPISPIARGSSLTSRFFSGSPFSIRLNSTSSSGSDTRTGSFIARFDTSTPSRPKEIRDQVAFAKVLVGVDANVA